MFSRVVLVVELGDDAVRVASMVKALLPGVEHVTVVAHLKRSWKSWFSQGPWDQLSRDIDRGEQLIEQVRDQLTRVASEVKVGLVHDLVAEEVVDEAKLCGAGAILLGPLSWTAAPVISRWLDALIKQADLPVLWVGEGKPQAAPPRTLLGVLWNNAAESRTFTSFLQSQPQTFARIVMLNWGNGADVPEEAFQSWRTLLGIEAELSVFTGNIGLVEAPDRLEEALQTHSADLLVLDAADVMGSWHLRFLTRDMLRGFGCPVLLLPSRRTLATVQLEVADSLWYGGPTLALHVRQPARFIGHGETPDRVHVLIDGEHHTTHSVHHDVVVLPLDAPPEAVGLVRARPQSGDDVSAETSKSASIASSEEVINPDAIEAYARVLVPGDDHVVLFDPALPLPDLLRLRALRLAAPARRFVAVSLSPAQSLTRLRQAMNDAGLGACFLLDAAQLLDDGGTTDLPDELLGLKLARIAYRMRADGFQVIAVAGQYMEHVRGEGFAILLSYKGDGDEGDAADVLSLQQEIVARYVPVTGPAITLGEELERLAMAEVSTENAIELDLDNRLARERLLALCARATQRIHIQIYIIKDDPLTAQLELVLLAAAARGVKVRILLDSLYSLHGSFGQANPWVQRMQAHPGVEVRTYRPIEGVPDVEDLKQRNHRKLLLFDGVRGLVTGRNLALTYYTGFEEISVTPETTGESIPWSDAGVYVEGPIVAALEASFLRDWEDTGGEHFALRKPQPVGDVACRFVRHDGLVDAYTLEAQLALIRAARRQLHVVNTFPLHQEVRHALYQAIERGVQVKLLIGNVRPQYGAERKPFPGGLLRDLANAVIHGRVDRLIEVGGEAYEFVLEAVEGWDPALFPVLPHVHSKLLTCDGLYVAIGSANLDVTGSFWESESLLVIEDASFTAQLDRGLEAMMIPAGKVDPEDTGWIARSNRRAWISESWPNILS